MCNEIITLWTIQSPEFDIRTGRVDHSKSEYYLTVPGVKEAYHELWQRLNIPEGQIIWCYAHENNIVKTRTEKIKWMLHFPRSEVICFVDNLVWNRILGTIHNVALRNMQNQWFEKWEKIPNNPTTLEAYIRMCEKEFRAQKPKTGSWWDELFVRNADESIDTIIHHPVPDKFVKEQITWCCS